MQGLFGREPAWPLVMGIINATPDSFSDGGRPAETLLADAGQMVADGAALLDLGGESTRPGAAPVSAEREQARILKLLPALCGLGVPVSVDTRHAATMRAAVAAGAAIVNDVSGLAHDPAAACAVAELGCGVVVAHSRGTPETMDQLCDYGGDLVGAVLRELEARLAAALRAGIAPERIALDPGLGFAKRGGQNLALLRALPRLRALGHPILVGASRKRFLGEAANEPVAARRDAAGLAAHLFAAERGAAVIRTHAVRETVQAIRVWRALRDPAIEAG